MKRLHLPIALWLLSLLSFALPMTLQAGDPAHGPANGTVLIIRHAEKPPKGDNSPDLAPEGVKRAQKYIQYFRPFRDGGTERAIAAIFASKDTHDSSRPRLTVEPLSQATPTIPLNTEIKKDRLQELADAVGKFHDKTVLVCWHHGEIPDLLTLYGIAPASLLGSEKWPDDIFGWVVVLHFDAQGALSGSKVVNEALEKDDREPPHAK